MSDPKFLRIVRQGDDLAEQGKYDSAIAKYQRALRMDPQSSDVRRKLIDMCKRKGAYREAISEYINWAEVCKRDSNYEQAIDIFQECLDMGKASSKRLSLLIKPPSTGELAMINEALEDYSAEIHWKLGLVYLAKSDLEEAAYQFKQSVEKNPSNPAEIHKHLGIIYTEQGKPNEAIGEYQEVICLAPDDASVYEQLGEICCKQNKEANAIKWFSQAGDIYFKKNEVQEAIRVYENILKFDPENMDILTKLGDIYSDEGLMDKAVQTSMRLVSMYTKEGLLDRVIILYERLLEWEPDNKEIRENVIVIYQKIVKLDPTNLQARQKLIDNLFAIDHWEAAIPELIGLGKIYIEKNLYEEGIGICQKVFEFDATNVEAHKMLAEIYTRQGLTDTAKEEYLLTMNLYREMGEHQKADETYQRMISLFPDSADMHYQLALNHFEKGEFDESIKEFKLVIEAEPQHIMALTTLGDIYIQKNMLEEGIEHFKKVLELNSINTEIRRKLVDVYLSIGNIEEAIKHLFELGTIHQEKKEFEQSIEIYRNILCYIPDSLEAREKLINVYYLQGFIDLIKPEYIFLANVYDKRGLPMKSIEMCKKVLELQPGDINVRKKLCKYYIKQGISDIAINEALSLANIYLEKGLNKYAIEFFHSVVELQPDSMEIRLKLGELLTEERNFNDAVNHYISLIDTYLNSNKSDEANKIYEKIVGMKIDNADIYVKLSDLYLKFKEINKGVAILEDLAKLYNSKGELDEALKVYEQIGDIYISKKMFENALTNYENIISIYSEKQKHKEKLPYYKKIIELLASINDNDRSLKFQKELASILCETGDFELSISEYKSIIQSYIKVNKISELPSIYNELTKCYLKVNRIDDAIKDCRDTISLYLENKMNSQAIEIYKIILELYKKENKNQEVIEIQKIIGDLYLAENNTEKAIDNYKFALKSFNEQMNYNASIDILKKIIELDVDNLDYRYNLIDLYSKLGCKEKSVEEYCYLISSQAQKGKFDSAIDIFQQSIKVNKNNPALHYCVANIYFDHKMWNEAIINYLKVLEQDSTYSGLYSKLTLACAYKGDLKEAIDWTKKLISDGKAYEITDEFKINKHVNITKYDAYYNLGIIYKEIGFIEDAIDTFRIASNNKSNHLNCLKMIGECFNQAGFTELAVRHYHNILDVSLDSLDISEEDYLEFRYNLGQTFESMNKFKYAKKAYEGICEISIKYKDTMERIMEMSRKIDNEKLNVLKDNEEADPKLIEFSELKIEIS